MNDKTNLYVITGDSLKQLYNHSLPLVLYLHSGESTNKTITDAVEKAARKYAGQVLVASVDVNENPTTSAKYQHLALPAVVTLEKKFFGMRERSSAGEVRPADVRNHIAYLLGQGDDPEEIAAREAAKSQPKELKLSGTHDVTEKTFKRDVLKSKMPVLVDFWAPWCGPCRQVSPMLEQLGEEYQGQIRVVKINVDDNKALSRKYNIMSIPTMMIFKGGTVVESTYGAQPRHMVKRMIDNALLD